MRKKRCEHDNCFTCPYKDCIASDAEIARKDRSDERNKIIVEDFINGTSVNGIAERLGVSSMTIRRVLKNAGITDYRQNWEKQQWKQS